MWSPCSSMRPPCSMFRPLAPLPPMRQPIWYTVMSYLALVSGCCVRLYIAATDPIPEPSTAILVFWDSLVGILVGKVMKALGHRGHRGERREHGGSREFQTYLRVLVLPLRVLC